MPLGRVRDRELGCKNALAVRIPVVTGNPDALGQGVGDLDIGGLGVARRVNLRHIFIIVHVELSEL